MRIRADKNRHARTKGIFFESRATLGCYFSGVGRAADGSAMASSGRKKTIINQSLEYAIQADEEKPE
jgi:hypothetical protein